jgi:CBS domain-containing protein
MHGPLGIENLQVVRGAFLTKLMWINVSLAVFNLLPAFPMDGGRLLRAALALKLNYVRATVVAAWIGRLMALVFGILGFFLNPVLLFIAFFVWISAQQEASLVRLKALLCDVPVHAAMITEFHVLNIHEPLARAVELIRSGFQQDFPVVDHEGVVTGLLTREDVLKGVASHGVDSAVGDSMRRAFGLVAPFDKLDEALTKLQRHTGRVVVVVHDGQPIGLVTSASIGEQAITLQHSPVLHPSYAEHSVRS